MPSHLKEKVKDRQVGKNFKETASALVSDVKEIAKDTKEAASDTMKYRGMDRNHDGVATRVEWKGNSQSFQNQDWNGDGITVALHWVRVRYSSRVNKELRLQSMRSKALRSPAHSFLV